MHVTVLTSPCPYIKQIRQVLVVKFGLHLSGEQFNRLLEKQPEELRLGLLGDKIDSEAIDLLIERVSVEITGVRYPTVYSTPDFKACYKKVLEEKRALFLSSL